MSTGKLYEESFDQLNDLSIPDQEQSWQKMKDLLEDDDDNHRPPPPFFLRTCAGWSLLMLLLTGTWILVRPDHWWNKNNESQQTKKVQQEQAKEQTQTSTTKKIYSKKETGKERQKENKSENQPIITTITETDRIIKEKQETRLTKQIKQNYASSTDKDKILNLAKGKKSDNKETLNNQPIPGNTPDKKLSITKDANKDKNNDSIAINKVVINEKLGEIVNKDKDTSIHLDEFNDLPGKQLRKKKYFTNIGIAVQQQIPIGGQDAVPYNYYGRKGSYYDYIPSLYIRLHREQKWFAQLEFRYGAPQSINDFSYSRQTLLDTANSNITTTTLHLIKTYYHQIPISFNYFIRPNWSIGFGSVFSRFYGAVSEQEVKNKNIQTQAETITKKIISLPGFTDSFLYKTQVRILFQTDYQWKRFSIGLRYKKDIQPFIKYTAPTGEINEEKNQALELILRFRLWQSKLYSNRKE